MLLNGPTYAYINPQNRTRNGKEAIKPLWTQYEVELAMSQSKNQAYETIKNASYSGGKQHWIFKIYITWHQKCHQGLEEYSQRVLLELSKSNLQLPLGLYRMYT
jgi:hypothetical protein